MTTPISTRTNADAVKSVVATAILKDSRREALKYASIEIANHRYLTSDDLYEIIDLIQRHWEEVAAK